MVGMQPMLDGLQLSLSQAIAKLPLQTLYDGKREVSPEIQQAVLIYLAGYKSKQCWQSAAKVAADPKMQVIYRGIVGRTIGSAFRVLARIGLIDDKKRLGRKIIRELSTECIRAILNGEKLLIENEPCSFDAIGTVRPNELGPSVLVGKDSPSLSTGTNRPCGLGPSVLVHTKEKEMEIETTTNIEDEWESLVVVLLGNDLDVKRARKAIESARARGF